MTRQSQGVPLRALTGAYIPTLKGAAYAPRITLSIRSPPLLPTSPSWRARAVHCAQSSRVPDLLERILQEYRNTPLRVTADNLGRITEYGRFSQISRRPSPRRNPLGLSRHLKSSGVWVQGTGPKSRGWPFASLSRNQSICLPPRT
jgi:hypothetical protein